MDIRQINRDRIIHVNKADQSLKSGQIVRGKILKLYPNNKAQIQLGSQTMVAQLELALSVGEQYHFRVESAGDVVHLKVIGEHLKNQAQLNTAALIKDLGLKVNRANINLVQELINQKIPFEKNDLIRSFALLESAKNKSEAQQILKEMIVQKWPITESIFQALLTKNTTTLSDQMREVVQQLRQHANPTQIEQNLLSRLSQIGELPPTKQSQFMVQMMTEAATNHQQIFETLKVAGLIDQHIDFSTWKSQWQAVSHQQIMMRNISVPGYMETAEQSLGQLESIRMELKNESQLAINRWTNDLSEMIVKNVPLSEQNLSHFKHEITEKVIPLLTRLQQYIVSKQGTVNEPIKVAEKTLQQLETVQSKLRIESQSAVDKWANLLHETIVKNTISSDPNLLQLKQEIVAKLVPLLTVNHLYPSNQQLSALNLPFSVDIEGLEQALQQMKSTQIELQSVSRTMVNKWSNMINEAVLKSVPLSAQNFPQFKQEITEKIMPLLSTNQQEQMHRKLENSPTQLRQLLTTLQTYVNEQTYTQIDQVLSSTSRQDLFNALSSQEQFLSQARQMLLFSGITHENLIIQETINQEPQTVKSMLIQMIQQGDSTSNDRSQQLLHFINGLQLQSVHEVGSFIQASMQLPGEKLGLNNDLYIDFESKKTEDGKINPDYCRILFYLDLASLDETIIDMQIQKRLVSIIVFNDHEQVKQQSVILQPMLSKGLETLGYQLSSVMIKPLQEMNHTSKKTTKQSYQNTYEGIEFRI